MRQLLFLLRIFTAATTDNSRQLNRYKEKRRPIVAIRVCSYNIEWFDDLFESNNTMKTGAKEQDRFGKIRDVIKGVDPDVLGIIEAPNTIVTNGTKNTITCLENFAAWAGLRTAKAAIGFISAGRQELAVLYDPAKVSVEHKPGGSNTKKNPKFDDKFYFDTDDDEIKEEYKLYRPPFEAQITITAGGAVLNLILVHTKSKGIFNSTDMVHWKRESLKNRKKLYAECTWIRRHIDQLLEAGKHVIVMGDINDGPGMDYYEMKFGRSAIEILMGDIFEPHGILRNYAGRPKWTNYGWEPASTRFKDRFTEFYINVLIDHILVSEGVPVTAGSHRVWNPYQLNEAKPLKDNLLKASDHFPVSIDVEL